MLTKINDLCTPIFHRWTPNLMAMRFELMKALPAFFRVKNLLLRNPKLTTVIESTSGTAGLGLAYVCREFGLRLILIADPAIDAVLQGRLEALGAIVIKVDARFKTEKGGFQKARLDELKRVLEIEAGAIWSEQYDCEDWSLAYAAAAGDLLAHGVQPDILIAACGSGASGCGVARALTTVRPIELHMVDTYGSVLFGTPEASRDLRGLGNSLVPKNLDYGLVDGVAWISNSAAVAAAYELNRESIDVGPTSGAAWLAARWLAHRFPTKQVVFICADDGRRYDEVVFNAAKVKALGEITAQDFNPRTVTHPSEVNGTDRFQYMAWGRRTLNEVLASPSQS